MITRRGLMGALAVAPLVAKTQTIQVGVSTNEFRDHTNASLAQELKGQGIKVIQLFFTQKDSSYWRYGVRSDLVGMTNARAADIAGIYKAAGISIQALGVYANLIHPDAAERAAHLKYFEAMMKLAKAMGVEYCLSEMGHYMPPAPTPTPYDWLDQTWKLALANAKELARMAEANGSTVLLESYHASVLASAKRTRMFVEEIGSRNVMVQLDPANLIEVNDLEEMFQQLGPRVRGIHAKDRKVHTNAGVAAGKGDLDYLKFVKLSAKHAPGVPLVIEYVGSKTYIDALTHLRATIQKAGFKAA